MSIRSSLFPSVLVLLPCSSALTTTLPAQLPPNHAVVGTLPDNSGAKSGLFYVSLKDGQTTRLTGVPPELEATSGVGGVTTVLHCPDGSLIAGNAARAGNPITMTKMTMAGPLVVAKKSLVIGTVPAGWAFGVSGALMPDGKRVLVGTSSSIQGTMSGFRLGIADFDGPSAQLTPVFIRTTLLGAFVYSVDVARDGTTAYVLTGTGNADARPFRLYMVNLKTGAAALIYTDTQRFPWPIEVRGDEIFTSSCDYYGIPARPTDFLRIKITGWGQATVTRTSTANVNEGLWGGPLDEASGLTLMLSWNFNSQTTANPKTLWLGDSRTGQVKVLARPPAGGWGDLNAFDLHSSMEPYGATPHEADVRFQTAPNPGGEPIAGNGNFSVSLETTATGASPVALMLIGLTPIDLPLAGTQLLLAPAIVLPVAAPTLGNNVTVPMPIPAGTPAGTQVYVQWARCTAAGCEGSRGMKIVTR